MFPSDDLAEQGNGLLVRYRDQWLGRSAVTGTPFSVLGVPSSAGSHYAGQEKAAGELRAAGLVDALSARGAEVLDVGDLPVEPFAVDHSHPRHRNLDAVVRVARTAADAVESIVKSGRVPLVLGGDCTITLGVVAGAQRSHPNVGLVYLDGDADLTTPETTTSGIMDSMGVAHLLGIADTELARLDHAPPMLSDDRLVMLGYNPEDTDSFSASSLLAHPGVVHFPASTLQAAPEDVATQALVALSARESPVIVHFDVDVVDSGDLPLGNFPHYGVGVTLRTASLVLRILCSAPRLLAVVLTEVNPGHEPSGEQLKRYVDAVSGALAPSP